MAFVFYHKFMWLKSRLQQAEKERQSAEEDNRLFKHEFGDKINSLQIEVEKLIKQRWRNSFLIYYLGLFSEPGRRYLREPSQNGKGLGEETGRYILDGRGYLYQSIHFTLSFRFSDLDIWIAVGL